MSPQNSCVEFLTPIGMVLGGGEFEKWWGHESGGSLVAQIVKNPPAMQETLVGFLGGEDPLEKEMAIPSTILAWEIPWTMEPGRLQSVQLQRVGHDWATNTNTLGLEGGIPMIELVLF